MTSWLEARVDRLIREAHERGDFDDLPGAGQPLPGRGEPYDEDWWIKEWIRRERLTGIVPTSLRVRKEAEELPGRLDRERSEAAVRRVVEELNARIDRVTRGLVNGPPVVLRPFDVEATVAAWRSRRR